MFNTFKSKHNENASVTIKHKLNINVYHTIGSMWSTSIEASSDEELVEKKKEFIKNNSVKAELIRFYNHVITITYNNQDMCEELQVTDEVTNPYAPKKYREETKE